MAHLEEKTISSEQKFDGRIVKLYVDKAELEDGKIVTREVIRHPGGVCVLPLTDKNEVMFVKQFRTAGDTGGQAGVRREPQRVRPARA